MPKSILTFFFMFTLVSAIRASEPELPFTDPFLLVLGDEGGAGRASASAKKRPLVESTTALPKEEVDTRIVPVLDSILRSPDSSPTKLERLINLDVELYRARLLRECFGPAAEYKKSSDSLKRRIFMNWTGRISEADRAMILYRHGPSFAKLSLENTDLGLPNDRPPLRE